MSDWAKAFLARTARSVGRQVDITIEDGEEGKLRVVQGDMVIYQNNPARVLSFVYGYVSGWQSFSQHIKNLDASLEGATGAQLADISKLVEEYLDQTKNGG